MNRLRELRRTKGLTLKEVGALVGVAESTMSLYESGKRQPDYEMLQTLAEFFGVSTDYLLGRSDYSDIPAPTTKGKWIPVLGRVQAGIPIEAVEDILDYEEISNEMAKTGDFFALQVRGASMEPRIHEGDVLIVRKQDDAETGDVCVVMVNGDDATVKRIKKSPEGLFLIANNPAFEPMFFSNREIDELPVQVIGKVVELRAKF